MKYFLWVLGCAMNYSDAERIATVMDLLGYEKTEEEMEADVIITVACSVRQSAIDRIYGKTRDWNKRKKEDRNLKTILSGCVLEQDKKKLKNSFDLIFEISEIEKLAEFLGRGKKVRGLSGEYLSLLPQHESSFRAYVPIMTGCDNFCSYCAVPYTRGREKSRPVSEIISEVKSLIKKGYREITLLGQNVNSYQFGFVSLLRKIGEIPGEYRVYFYSNHPKDMSDELISTLPKLKHFPRYLHLPLQSGNDRILKSMNRNYTSEEYSELVQKIRKAIPDVVLTTDIIVGYPGEGEKEFDDTLDVVKKSRFEMIFIGQYSPRPGTKSAKLADDVPKSVKKKRDRIITNLLAENLTRVNEKLVGKTVRALIDEQKNGKWYGRTDGYKVVEIKTDQALTLGQFIDVKVNSAGAWKLGGSTL